MVMLTEMSRRASWDVTQKDVAPCVIYSELTTDNKIRTKIDTTNLKLITPDLLDIDKDQEKEHYLVARADAAKAIFWALKEKQKNATIDLLNLVSDAKNRISTDTEDKEILAKAKANATLRKQQSYYGDYRPSKDFCITIAKKALSKAIIDKFFESELAQYKANMKNGAFRAMNITDEDKELAKSWFADHITNIKFRFPKNDDDSYCGLLTIPESELERRDNSSREVVKRWDDSFDNFMYEFPDAVEGKDYEFRLTSAESDPYKYIWNPGCSITIDEPFVNAPTAAKDMLARAKSGAKNAKGYEDTVSDNMISSYWLGIAIMRLFNGDFNFYEKRRRNRKQAATDFSDALINDYEN